MWEAMVETAAFWEPFPFHCWILQKVPFFFPVVSLMTLMSRDWWVKSLVMEPLGPTTVTFLALEVILTGGVSGSLTIRRDSHEIFLKHGSHLNL